jgi:hypothetical protein
MKKMVKNKKKFIVVSIVPTGIRCSIGGYIGDATLATNKLATTCDYLITNPNAVNAGAFNFKEKNVLYTEGATIDNFFERKIELLLPQKNKIGIILEKIDDKIGMKYALKSIEAFREVAGIDIAAIEFIPKIKKDLRFEYGQFCAEIPNIEPVIAAAEKLLKKGVDAIAISTHIPFDKKFLRQYQKGLVPNPYGLIEALFSHTISHLFNVPTAHAPILTKADLDLYLFDSFSSDPRSSFENISGAYLGSILLGLNTAPRLTPKGKGEIQLNDVAALVIPSNCLRSLPAAIALKHNIPIIEVSENKNIFNELPAVTTKKVLKVKTYDDAVKKIIELKT